ncbi:MAG: tRNA uridine-5-carboxymethylaminomethyl(34) synthesis GTPase MnmE [Bacteroidales bacterium]|nr:tRNA uridine-5-carboxymethylaminomethyl(34) synthesis GTPase MnmE [Bacteroidales bacterium]
MMMEGLFDSTDTICAISTAPGVGGIAVARISGAKALECVDKLWRGKPLAGVASHTAHLGTIIDPADGSVLDQGVATVFRGPNSFTGEDVVELSIHGSRWIQRQLISLLVAAGCRLANPGEFTRRAFLAGKLDLAEAEAVADLIASSSRASHRIAVSQMRGGISRKLDALRAELLDLASLLELELDFSEEEVEFASRQRLIELADEVHGELQRLGATFARGAAIKDGIPVAIVGRTNAGKSSLLNALLGDDRAIVSDIHGTTRDTIEETIELGDYLFRFIDTAGLRATDDSIERIGIERSRRAMQQARIIIAVIDATQPVDEELLAELAAAEAHVIYAINKTDCAPAPSLAVEQGSVVAISALNGQGIDELTDKMTALIAEEGSDDDVILTNARHAEAIAAATRSISATADALRSGIPADLVAQDLRETLHHLSAITGTISTPEILATIFSRFCVGK